MSKSNDIKTDLLRRMGQHVLSHGLATASLRPLAQAAGTSDRMLIYHFGSKDALMADLLHHLAQDLSVKLDRALPIGQSKSNKDFLANVVALLRRDPYRRYMRLWLDIVSAAGQGSEMHRAIGKAMIDGYLEWLGKRLPESGDDPKGLLALLLTLVEGVVVMDAVGQGSTADRAIAEVLKS